MEGTSRDVTAGYWDWPWWIDNGDDSYRNRDTVNYKVWDNPNYGGAMQYCAVNDGVVRNIPSDVDNKGDSHSVYTGACFP